MSLITNDNTGASITIKDGKADVNIAKGTPVSITSNGLVLNVAKTDGNIIKVAPNGEEAVLYAVVFDGEYQSPEYDEETQTLEIVEQRMRVTGTDSFVSVQREVVKDQSPSISFAVYDVEHKKYYIAVDRKRMSVADLKKAISVKANYKVDNPGIPLGERDVLFTVDGTTTYGEDVPELAILEHHPEYALYTYNTSTRGLSYIDSLSMYGVWVGAGNHVESRDLSLEASPHFHYDDATNEVVAEVEVTTSDGQPAPKGLVTGAEAGYRFKLEKVESDETTTIVTLRAPTHTCEDVDGGQLRITTVNNVGRFSTPLSYKVTRGTSGHSAVALAGVGSTGGAYIAVRLGENTTTNDIILQPGWEWVDTPDNALNDAFKDAKLMRTNLPATDVAGNWGVAQGGFFADCQMMSKTNKALSWTYLGECFAILGGIDSWVADGEYSARTVFTVSGPNQL